MINQDGNHPATRIDGGDGSDIQVKALAVVLDEARTRHLVFRARNRAGMEFHRSLGGSIERGERSHEAVVREIREELNATFVPDGLLGVVESIFELDGVIGHEVVFVYIGSFAEREVVPDHGRAFNDIGSPGWAEWRSITNPPPHVALFPERLQALLDDWINTRPHRSDSQ